MELCAHQHARVRVKFKILWLFVRRYREVLLSLNHFYFLQLARTQNF